MIDYGVGVTTDATYEVKRIGPPPEDHANHRAPSQFSHRQLAVALPSSGRDTLPKWENQRSRGNQRTPRTPNTGKSSKEER